MAQPTKADLRRNLKALKRRLDDKPMDLDARMRMARTHQLMGEDKPAIAHYSAVARYLSLGGHPLQAIAVLKELLGVAPRHEETLLFLAKLYARTGGGEEPHARSRVAVPVSDAGPIALPDGLPASASGLWRAIRPQATDVMPAHTDDEPISIAAELRELEETFAITDDDVVDVRDANDPLAEVPDISDEAYEIIGAVTTEDVVLPKVALFSQLDPLAFIELGHAMVFHRTGEGEVIFDEGDPADSFLVIARGEAVATRAGVELMTLHQGDFAGLFALLARGRRHARLTAKSYVEYFEIDRAAVDALIAKHESARDALSTLAAERTLLHALAALPGLNRLGAGERRALADALNTRAVEAEEVLSRAGRQHPGLWIVLSGRVAVELDDETEIPLEPGDCYLHAGPGKSRRDVRAAVGSRVVRVEGDALAPLLGSAGDLTASGWSIGGDEYCGRDLLV
jgi:CRP-like cAMP-binding protein